MNTSLIACADQLPCHPHDDPRVCEPHKHDERAVTDLKPGEFRVRGWGRFWKRLEDGLR